jgi:GNAT superfamily N-acetyltransferase
MPCHYEERKPSVEEFIKLRKAVGWNQPAEEAIKKGLEGTLYAVCALEGDEVIGMARVVGDGATVFYIQDVMVMPEYQNQGIGTALMGKVMDYIRREAAQGAVVGLMSALGREAFYQKLGFWVRPNDHFGPGMMQFWGETF